MQYAATELTRFAATQAHLALVHLEEESGRKPGGFKSGSGRVPGGVWWWWGGRGSGGYLEVPRSPRSPCARKCLLHVYEATTTGGDNAGSASRKRATRVEATQGQ